MDRIDLFIEVPKVKYERLVSPDQEGESQQVKKRVEKARDIQKTRFKTINKLVNSEMGLKEIKKYCQTDNASQSLLKKYGAMTIAFGAAFAPFAASAHEVYVLDAATVARDMAMAGVCGSSPSATARVGNASSVLVGI